MMLMVPASKVSVPLTVVMRTWVKVSERVLEPFCCPPAAAVVPVVPCSTQELFWSFVITAAPTHTYVATFVADTKNPADIAVLIVFADQAVPAYPLVSMPPLSPSWIWMLLVLFVLTPSNITVMRLTHDGMPVKSIEVPLVDATAVARVREVPKVATVPVLSGNVRVRLVLVAGGTMVAMPVPLCDSISS